MRRLLAVIVGVVVLPGWLVLGVGSAAYGAGTLPEVPGVIEDGLYESPQFGFEVAWEEPWDFPPEPEIEPATSEPGNDVLNLSLAHPAEHDVYLSVGGIAIEDNDPDAPAAVMQELLDFWESDAYAETLPGDTVEILLSDIDDTSVAALMTWDDPASGTGVRLVQAVVSDDGSSFIQVNLRTTGVTFPAALPWVQDGIEVDGDSPFTVLDDRDILESVEDLGLDPGDDGGLIIDNDDDSDTTPDADDGDHDQDDADTYLDDVSDHYGDLDASVDRFFEILDSERITDADFADLEEILAGWHAAAETATSRNAPAALDDVQAAYLAYTQALGDAASAFEDFAAADPDSAEEDDALEAFGAAMSEVESAGADLEAALADVGV